MNSTNKPAPTVAEREHIARLKEMPCILCGCPPPSDCHEPEQGLWWVSVPLCRVCHMDNKYGWHGSRLNWKARKWTSELPAINATVRLLMETA